MAIKKLYRSRYEKKVGGVCSGIAKYLSIDVTLVRIITFVAIAFGGVSIWVYILAMILIPVEPSEGPIPIQIVDDEDEPIRNKKAKENEYEGPEW
jgi:phage shock protein C